MGYGGVTGEIDSKQRGRSEMAVNESSALRVKTESRLFVYGVTSTLRPFTERKLNQFKFAVKSLVSKYTALQALYCLSADHSDINIPAAAHSGLTRQWGTPGPPVPSSCSLCAL